MTLDGGHSYLAATRHRTMNRSLDWGRMLQSHEMKFSALDQHVERFDGVDRHKDSNLWSQLPATEGLGQTGCECTSNGACLFLRDSWHHQKTG